jgi:hypothetical protein
MDIKRRQFLTLSSLPLLSFAAAVSCTPSQQESNSGSAPYQVSL